MNKDLKMKNLLFAAITSLLINAPAIAAQEAYQAGADQIVDILNCQPLVLRPDVGMSVIVQTGGIAGLTQIQVKKFFLGHSTAKTYIVKALTRPSGMASEGITYSGTEIRLTVNFTAQTPNGGHFGVILITENGSTTTTELSCSLILQNPQVNYAY